MEVERKIKIRERKERRNIILKEVEVKDGKRREVVEKVLKIIGVTADIEEIRKLGEEEGKSKEMLLLKLRDEEQKRY